MYNKMKFARVFTKLLYLPSLADIVSATSVSYLTLNLRETNDRPTFTYYFKIQNKNREQFTNNLLVNEMVVT